MAKCPMFSAMETPNLAQNAVEMVGTTLSGGCALPGIDCCLCRTMLVLVGVRWRLKISSGDLATTKHSNSFWSVLAQERALEVVYSGSKAYAQGS